MNSFSFIFFPFLFFFIFIFFSNFYNRLELDFLVGNGFSNFYSVEGADTTKIIEHFSSSFRV